MLNIGASILVFGGRWGDEYSLYGIGRSGIVFVRVAMVIVGMYSAQKGEERTRRGMKMGKNWSGKLMTRLCSGSQSRCLSGVKLQYCGWLAQ